jgi:hypothetical protein
MYSVQSSMSEKSPTMLSVIDDCTIVYEIKIPFTDVGMQPHHTIDNYQRGKSFAVVNISKILYSADRNRRNSVGVYQKTVYSKAVSAMEFPF